MLQAVGSTVITNGRRVIRRALLAPRLHQSRGIQVFRVIEPRERQSKIPNSVPDHFKAGTGHRSLVSLFVHEWHRPDFMEGETLEAKERWLADLKSNYPTEVDPEAYAVVLRAIANSSTSGAPQRVEALVNNMSVEPNVSCYHAVLTAWANASREDIQLCVVRGELWFSKILEPTIEIYHTLLHLFSRGRIKINNKARAVNLLKEHASKAEEVLKTMTVPPDTKSYNYVIRAWSQIRQHPELRAAKIKEWVLAMEKVQRENPAGLIQPDRFSYCMYMDAYAVLAGNRAKRKVSDGLQEVEHVEDILNYMLELERKGNPNVSPNTVAYNILISAYARMAHAPDHQDDAPLKAEKVLRRMIAIGKDATPDTVTFTKVILAWTNAKRETSGLRANYWLDKQWEFYEEKGQDESLRPNIGSYNAVMKAWKDNPKELEKVFMELLRAEKAASETILRPNTESFTLVIHSWVKHDISRALMWLEELMRREKDILIDPRHAITTTPDLFEVIIKQASNVPSLDNFSLGLKVFEHLRSSRHAIEVNVYGCLLRLGLQALSHPRDTEQRNKFLSVVIQDCKDDGLVSNLFLRVLANGPIFHDGWTAEASKIAVQEHFSEWPIPSSWTRNIHEQYMPRQADCIRNSAKVFYRNSIYN